MTSLRVLPARGLLVHHPAAPGASQLRVRNIPQTPTLPASRFSRFQPLRCQHSPPSDSTSHRVHGSFFARPSLALKTSKPPSSSSMPPPLANEVGQDETNTLSIRRNTVVDTDAASGALGTPSSFRSLFLDAVSQHWKPALACLLISAFLWCTPADNALAAQGGGRAGGSAFSSSRARSNSAPQRSYSAPQRSYSAPQRSYSAPQRSYSAPQQSYSAPQRSYSPPQRSFSTPQRSYSAPQQTYSAPQQSNSAPQQSYSAPQRSYSAPWSGYFGGAYVAPSPSFSAPFFFSPTPFFSPFASGPTVVVGGGGGGGFFSLVFFGIVALFVLSAILNL